MSLSAAATSQLINSAGIDTQSLIAQLISADQQSFIVPLQNKQTQISASITEYNNLKAKVSPVQTAARKLTDSLLFSSSDLFNTKVISSSDSTTATATGTTSALSNTYSLAIDHLATATKASSTASIGSVMSNSTLVTGFTNGTVSTGSFSVFVNGSRYDIPVNGKSGIATTTSLSSFPNGSVTSGNLTVTVNGTPQTIAVDSKNDKVSDVLDRIKAVLPGGSYSLDSNGSITFSYTHGATVSIGAPGDSTNFASMTGLANTTTTTGVATDTLTQHNDTVGDVLSRVAAVLPGGSYLIDGSGKISLTYTHGATVSIGSSGDTSNFTQLAGLGNTTTTTGVGTDTIASQNGVSTVDTSKTLTNNSAGLQTTVTAGTFTIGSKKYTIDANTTLGSVIGAINNDGQVVATFNSLTNELEITSKNTGAKPIALGATGDTSNFLSAINLVSGGDSLTSQSLGRNAQFSINGTTYQSTSNSNITSTVHGLAGVTLNLLQPTTVSNPAVTLTVAQDQASLKTAVQGFLDSVNSLVSFVRQESAVSTDPNTNKPTAGPLASDTGALGLMTQIRSLMTTTVSGLNTYTNLTQIGITTGSAGQSASSASSSSYSLDASKFADAMANNPTEVKALLLGNGTGNSRGIIQRVKDIMDTALNPTFGIFTARTTSANAQLKSINDSIDRVNERLLKKQTQLQQQFSQMNQLVASLKQQQSTFNAR